MKKLYYFFIIASIICSCGNNRSNNATENDYDSVEEIEKPSYANDFASVQKACYANDYESAHQILANLRQNAIDKAEGGEYSKTRAEYLSALETIYTSELTYIVLNFPEDAELRIAIRMNELQALGEKPTGDNYTWYSIDDGVDVPKKKGAKGYEYNSYMLWAQTYNAICSKLLDLAISIRNQHLAQAAISLIKDNLRINRYSGKKPFLIDFVHNDRETITKKYEDAVNSGLFE